MKAVIQPGKSCNWVTGIDAGGGRLMAVQLHDHSFFAMRRLRKLSREIAKVENGTTLVSGESVLRELKS